MSKGRQAPQQQTSQPQGAAQALVPAPAGAGSFNRTARHGQEAMREELNRRRPLNPMAEMPLSARLDPQRAVRSFGEMWRNAARESPTNPGQFSEHPTLPAAIETVVSGPQIFVGWSSGVVDSGSNDYPSLGLTDVDVAARIKPIIDNIRTIDQGQASFGSSLSSSVTGTQTQTLTGTGGITQPLPQGSATGSLQYAEASSTAQTEGAGMTGSMTLPALVQEADLFGDCTLEMNPTLSSPITRETSVYLGTVTYKVLAV